MSHLFYTKLAKYYDKIYHYVDYEKQARFFKKLIKKYGPSANNKILDIACGTGTHANLLTNKGFDVTSIDISPEMIKEARKKYPKIKFYLGDMKSWKNTTKFGVAIIFYNSILYSKNATELKITLKNCYDLLDKNGILIFDTVDKSIGINSTKKTLKYKDKNLAISFAPQWIYNQKENVMDLEIDFAINGDKVHDHHAMGAFSFKDLKQLAEKAGFEVLILERNFDEITAHNSHNKTALFLCKKSASILPADTKPKRNFHPDLS